MCYRYELFLRKQNAAHQRLYTLSENCESRWSLEKCAITFQVDKQFRKESSWWRDSGPHQLN